MTQKVKFWNEKLNLCCLCSDVCFLESFKNNREMSEMLFFGSAEDANIIDVLYAEIKSVQDAINEFNPAPTAGLVPHRGHTVLEFSHECLEGESVSVLRFDSDQVIKNSPLVLVKFY